SPDVRAGKARGRLLQEHLAFLGRGQILQTVAQGKVASQGGDIVSGGYNASSAIRAVASDGGSQGGVTVDAEDGRAGHLGEAQAIQVRERGNAGDLHLVAADEVVGGSTGDHNRGSVGCGGDRAAVRAGCRVRAGGLDGVRNRAERAQREGEKDGGCEK